MAATGTTDPIPGCQLSKERSHDPGSYMRRGFEPDSQPKKQSSREMVLHFSTHTSVQVKRAMKLNSADSRRVEAGQKLTQHGPHSRGEDLLRPNTIASHVNIVNPGKCEDWTISEFMYESC